MTSTFAVVLSGGGARGAYEAGVLSILLPALDGLDMRPDLFVGTSAGAINAVGFASLHHLGAAASSAAVLDLWREVHAGSVFRPPLRATLGRLTGRGDGRRRAGGLLDTAPLTPTLERLVAWDQLHANVDKGITVGVGATAAATRDSTVFVETRPGIRPPPRDDNRAITYVATPLEARHVLASSAIPVLFPAVEVQRPAAASGWYFDGGVRLNTQIKPATALGAERVLVVATASADPPSATRHSGASRPPGLAAGAAQLLYAMLDDRMVEDLRTLAKRNEPVADGAVIPWLFGGPRRDHAGLLGRLVCEVLEGAGPAPRPWRGALSTLARRQAGRFLAEDPDRGEVVSYLFFDAEFIEGAIRLGRRDAERSLGPDGAPVWHEAGITAGSAG